MRVIQCTTRVDMAAADFWALRMDQNFDAFCARCDDTDMELLSRREEQSNGQTLQVIECLLLYRESPVPATFQHMFGERRHARPAPKRCCAGVTGSDSCGAQAQARSRSASSTRRAGTATGSTRSMRARSSRSHR